MNPCRCFSFIYTGSKHKNYFITKIYTAINIKIVYYALHVYQFLCLLINYSCISNFMYYAYNLYQPRHLRAPLSAPSGPKFFDSQNCCGSENRMPPKFFEMWMVTEALLG